MTSASLRDRTNQVLWWLASIGLFVGIWETAYILGLYDRAALPAPHVFIPQFPEAARSFDVSGLVTGQAQQVNPVLAIVATTGTTMLRVIVGLTLGFTAGVATGVAIRFFNYFGKLTLPSITLLAPISPFAWLPIAIFLVGLGDAAAIALVFVAVYFIIVLSTIAEIDTVKTTYINVARIMGATRKDIYFLVILPAILPGLFLILRLNLFAAWMMVLVAESAGVGTGLGMVIMMARNTANYNLVFLGLFVIGIACAVLDFALRFVQRRLLYWLDTKAA